MHMSSFDLYKGTLVLLLDKTDYVSQETRPKIVDSQKAKFGLKCILSYYVPVQTIVSPYNANRLRHTIDISNYISWVPFWENCLVWLKVFIFLFFETCTQPFCKRHYPSL